MYNVTDGEIVSFYQRLPCSAGLSSVVWTGDCDDLATVDTGGVVTVWDTATPTRRTSVKIPDCPSSGLHWSWACLGQGYHPQSVLVAERTRVQSCDIRSGTWSQLGLELRGWDHVRHVDSDNIAPYCYVMTDHCLKLLDMRQPRSPVISRDTGVGVHSPAWNYSRTRVGSRDWVVMSDRWGDTRVSVWDWGHDTCQDYRPESDRVELTCKDDTLPHLLGGVTSVGSWRDTVTRARQGTIFLLFRVR